MNLIIDIGNSRAKVVVMDGDTLVKEYVAECFSISLFEEIMGVYPTISRAIIASTRGDEERVKEIVTERIAKVVVFKPATTTHPRRWVPTALRPPWEHRPCTPIATL